MVVRIVIAGESQCEVFAEICLIADYLSQNLPCFCYERIEKPIIEWQAWLSKINKKNKWHHLKSPLVWKELLLKGSRAYYIGGGPEFLEYCHSYYEFETFLAPDKVEDLSSNYDQFLKKIKAEDSKVHKHHCDFEIEPPKGLVVAISGVGNPLAMHIISGLIEMANLKNPISNIFIYDRHCSQNCMYYIEKECSFIGVNQPTRVVKYIENIGTVLSHTNLLILMNYVPFSEDMSIGKWLHQNHQLMMKWSRKLNASASRKLYVLFPNVGPACYNATVLGDHVHIDRRNILVATSDLGLEIMTPAAEIAELPLRSIFCPPVWGFVGINHLVDIRTTMHKYNSFEPYRRYSRVKHSSLMIGSLTPELRTMEYLMYFDETLWSKVVENKQLSGKNIDIHKAIAVLDVVKNWLIEPNPKNVMNLGIHCNGEFNLTFKGVFSQPSRFCNGFWVPASGYLLPKDPNMSLDYLQKIAEMVMLLDDDALPKINQYYPCCCKPKIIKKKEVW